MHLHNIPAMTQRELDRLRLAADVEAYLKSGNEITELEYGATKTDEEIPRESLKKNATKPTNHSPTSPAAKG